MGAVQDKCSCLFKKVDKETVQLEGNIIKEELELEARDNITFKDKLMKNKNSNTNFDKLILEEDINMSRSRLESFPSFDETRAHLVILIQKLTRGYLVRMHLTQIRMILNDYENDLIDQYQRNFKTMTLLKAEREAKGAYEKNGWSMFYDDSSLFEFNYGKVFNVRIHVYDKQAYYNGDMNIEGEKHGFGVLLSKNGVKQEGYWRNDAFTGWGRLIDLEGTIYEGLYHKGVLDRKGCRTTIKSYYKGDFKGGLREGIGSEETPEHFYVGEYKIDKKHGNGKLTYKKMNDIYEGEFQENSISGYGFYIWANNDTYKGTFINGKMHGRGLYKWPDGGEYIGEYTNNIKEGQGRFKWSNGKIFEGPFKGGRPHGTGKLIYGDNIIDVEFKDGKLVRTPTTSMSVIKAGKNTGHLEDF